VFVELPELGDQVTKEEQFGVLESVKAAADLYSPMSGEVVEINTLLADEPEQINKEPYGKGTWFVKQTVGRFQYSLRGVKGCCGVCTCRYSS